MAFFKVDKVFTYTETVYVESDDKAEATMIASDLDGRVNGDDSWFDTRISEVSSDEFESES